MQPDILIVLVVGVPGSGKSTLVDSLCIRHPTWVPFRTGQYIRSLSHTTTSTETLQLLFEKLSETVESVAASGGVYNGIVLDRFGAIPGHFAFLQGALQQHGLRVSLILHVSVPADVAMDRLLSREATDNARKTNDVRKRLDVNEHLHASLRRLVVANRASITWADLDGTQPPEAVVSQAVLAVEGAKGKLSPPASDINIDVQSLSPVACLSPVAHFDEYLRVLSELASRVKNRYLHGFPGTLIGSILTRELMAPKEQQVVYYEDYLAGVKVDGTRYLVMKYQGRLYFIPRSLETILYLSAGDAQAAWSGGADKYRELADTTVIDGELVQMATAPGTFLFITFDVLVWNGRTMFWFPFRKRQHVLPANLLVEDLFYSRGPPDPDVPLFILYKSYFHVRDLATRPMLDEFPHYATDGFILQHKWQYGFQVDTKLYKWKPESKRTADFLVTAVISFENGMMVMQLTTAEDESTPDVPPLTVNCRVSLESLGQHGVCTNPTGAVVECAVVIDAASEKITWRFVRYRNDKKMPNRSSVVKELLEANHPTLADVRAWAGEMCAWPKRCAVCTILQDPDNGRYHNKTFSCKRCWGKLGYSNCSRCDLFTKCPTHKKQNGRPKYFCDACKSKVGDD